MHHLSLKAKPKLFLLDLILMIQTYVLFLTLKTLISQTSHLRTSNDRKQSVFLITKQPFTPASVDTVANWIKKVMKRSSHQLTAKDVRSTAASLAQNSGADLATVL